MPTPKQKRPKQSYAQLKKIWYKKLKESGFEDIETEKGYLLGNSYNLLNITTLQWEAKETYYRLATAFLNDYTFETPLDRSIWEYRTNGISIRNITKTLQKIKIRTNRDKVWDTVHKLENAMKAKYLK